MEINALHFNTFSSWSPTCPPSVSVSLCVCVCVCLPVQMQFLIYVLLLPAHSLPLLPLLLRCACVWHLFETRENISSAWETKTTSDSRRARRAQDLLCCYLCDPHTHAHAHSHTQLGKKARKRNDLFAHFSHFYIFDCWAVAFNTFFSFRHIWRSMHDKLLRKLKQHLLFSPSLSHTLVHVYVCVCVWRLLLIIEMYSRNSTNNATPTPHALRGIVQRGGEWECRKGRRDTALTSRGGV